MLIKKIFQSLPSNLVLFLITFLVFIPVLTIYCVLKFYLFTVRLSIQQLKKGLFVRFYQYLTSQQADPHVEFR